MSVKNPSYLVEENGISLGSQLLLNSTQLIRILARACGHQSCAKGESGISQLDAPSCV